MKRTTPALFALTASCAAYAGLDPRTNATLYSHMVETNAQWRTMNPALASDARLVHFNNEAERIATHLRLVEDFLKRYVPAGLSPDALAKRIGLLNDLGAYADRGIFPQNHVLPYRNPVFIDPYGTACAVGQLMIESGHRDLAERISREMNLAYVHEINLPELGTWAVEQGFNSDELAWIQPSYPFHGLAEGNTNGPVTTVLFLGYGNSGQVKMLVVGDFTMAAGVACHNVSMNVDHEWQPMGNGLNGIGLCAVNFQDMILVGGSFQGGESDLALWDGAQWIYTSAFDGPSPVVNALHIHNGRLFAAGTIMGGLAGPTYGVVKRENGIWIPVGDMLNGPVNDMHSRLGNLVIGGSFTGTGMPMDMDSSIMHVGHLVNGSWQQLADGLNAPVHDLEKSHLGEDLYAGGDIFDAEGNRVFGLARIHAGDMEWTSLLSGPGVFVPTVAPSRILALHHSDPYLHLGGRFRLSDAENGYTGYAQYDPEFDGFALGAWLNRRVLDVETWPGLGPGNTVIAGAFTSLGGSLLVSFIAADGYPPCCAAAPGLDIGITPNPASDRIAITYEPTAPTPLGTLIIRDAMGRLAVNETIDAATRHELDISGLAPGVYSVSVTDGGHVGIRTFLKQ